MGIFDNFFGKNKSSRQNSEADDLTKHVSGLAQKAVDASRDRGLGILDYSEGSLKIIEDMLEEIPAIGVDPKTASIATVFSSYILEVGRRHFGGKYSWYEKGNQPVLVVGAPSYRIAIITLDRVLSRMNGNQEDNIPFFFEGFSSAVRNAKPGDDQFHV